MCSGAWFQHVSVLICCMGGTDGEQPVREGLCGNPDGLNRY
jgi:hypothetical protein